MKTNNTLAIKAKFSNAIHKILEPNLGVKKRDLWQKQYQDKYKFTDSQKIEMFDEIFRQHRDCSNELSMYFYNRRLKRRVQKARVARGYVAKKKTPKSENLASVA